MDLFGSIKQFFKNKNPTETRFQLLRDVGNGIYTWNGKMFQSEAIRSCVRPFATAAGKLAGKQIREGKDGKIQENPDLYIKVILEEPNPLMCGQVFQEKMANQYYINNNAFAYINRDPNGYAMELYPIDAYAVEAIYDKQRNLFLKFSLVNGKQVTYPYSDVLHLRRDFCDNDIFGSGNDRIIQPLMDVVVASDQSVVKAIQNSGVIKWLLKFNRSIRAEDLPKHAAAFAQSFLNSSEELNVGVAATDTNADAIQVEPKDYVPNALIMDRTMKRVYSYFNTNEKIIMSNYTENEWNSYYESVVEPFALQMSQEFTRKIFSKRERGHGNKIVFDASSLQYASMQTKLNLVSMVDRGAMLPNEWRRVLNLSPIEGGDQPIRRLDTAVVSTTKGGENE